MVIKMTRVKQCSTPYIFTMGPYYLLQHVVIMVSSIVHIRYPCFIYIYIANAVKC